MIDATYQQVGINFLLADKYQFKYSGSSNTMDSKKYMIFLRMMKEKPNKRILQDLKKGDELLIKEINMGAEIYATSSKI